MSVVGINQSRGLVMKMEGGAVMDYREGEREGEK